ncbi:hypothetical protein CEXT_10171 [Caerostris extrusa]|uniref:Orn/DAP/Arg decarboxylase 2 C-terminal domain-containing protein n=1 Tax=Caerostris extrusa TaxID=172846 RepID=A0AAV4WM84_CAEEX|nr:hypothetical protein CEXT_10171 [Caerostris extrusa]
MSSSLKAKTTIQNVLCQGIIIKYDSQQRRLGIAALVNLFKWQGIWGRAATHSDFFVERSTTNGQARSSCAVASGASRAAVDVIVEKCMLPELNVGDWLMIDDMGAYTTASINVQRFRKTEVIYIEKAM